MGRFTEAIAEGDGISIVPSLEGDVGALAAAAEERGAEAVAVSLEQADAARGATSLPLIVDGGVHGSTDVESLAQRGADGWIVFVDLDGGESRHIDDLFPIADGIGVDSAVEVCDGENLADVLERLDPEILVIAHPRPDGAEEELEYILDLLPDVPAGKLVMARVRSQLLPEQVIALERAGVDAVLVGADVLREPDFSAALGQLTGR
jgi:indole-3-glycerol phosphate synthase